jgi:hypothetical protein
VADHASIPFGEAWLLEVAVRAHIPLNFLAEDEEKIYLQFAHPGHHLNREQLVETLEGLLHRGEIIVREREREGFIPTRSQLEEAVIPLGFTEWKERCESGRVLYYGLTPAGAERWEQAAAPNWDRFFRDSYPKDKECEIVAGSWERLQELLVNADFLWAMEPIRDSIVEETIAPWEATCWKTLPPGYMARFRYKLTGRSYPATPEHRAKMTALRCWATSIRGYEWF